MAEKERREKEAIAHAAEQERMKHTVLTEANFPSHLVSTAYPRTLNLQGFASRAAEAEHKERQNILVQQYRRQRAAMDARSNRIMSSGVVSLRRSRKVRDVEEEYEDEPQTQAPDLSELYPQHGPRRYSTLPDSDGWREVTRYYRRQRVMTNAELERKARAEILGEEDEQEDVNADLNDLNQRRGFY
jgi:hypothetical protein